MRCQQKKTVHYKYDHYGNGWLGNDEAVPSQNDVEKQAPGIEGELRAVYCGIM